MLDTYIYTVSLGSAYGGQAGALAAWVEDTGGNLVADIPITELIYGGGEYEGVVTLDTALAARIRYAWTGTPAINLSPDIKLPEGLPTDTFYAYPVCVGLGSRRTGQADQLSANAYGVNGALLTSIGPFVEKGTGTGEYEANPQFNSSWRGLIRYGWAGNPTLGLIGPDTFAPLAAAGSNTTNLTGQDLDNIEQRVRHGIGIPTLNALPFAVNLAPQTARSGLATITPPLVPGTDRTILISAGGLPSDVRLVSATMGLRTGNPPAPVVHSSTTLADRFVTTTTDPTVQGQITSPGVPTGTGYAAVQVLFHFSHADTALVAPGAKLSYFVTAVDSKGQVYELEQGSWVVLTGGPLG